MIGLNKYEEVFWKQPVLNVYLYVGIYFTRVFCCYFIQILIYYLIIYEYKVYVLFKWFIYSVAYSLIHLISIFLLGGYNKCSHFTLLWYTIASDVTIRASGDDGINHLECNNEWRNTYLE